MPDDYRDLVNEIRESEKRQKEHVSETLRPLRQQVEGHQGTLYGHEGRGGLVGDMNRIKFLGKLAAFFAGIGALFVASIKWLFGLKGG